VHRARGRRLSPLTRHRFQAFGTAILAALAVVFFAPDWLKGTVRLVAGYDAAAIVLLAYFWAIGIKDDPAATHRRAAVEDPGRNVVLGIVVLSCLIGLASAVIILGRGPNVPEHDRGLALAIGLSAVVLGWLLIHTSFIFRYAHLYYVGDEAGAMRKGLVFPGTPDPDDYDFAYFSFVLGMTFQVSDVQIIDQEVRKLAMLHGLLAFAYNTAILALVVNLASGLLGMH
jgi:uncharacterized membrane protein